MTASRLCINGSGGIEWSLPTLMPGRSSWLVVTGVATAVVPPGLEFSNLVGVVQFQRGPSVALSNYTLQVLAPLDYGDAPDPQYPTRFASNGARHRVGALTLVASVDAENDGAPSSNADGDDTVASDDENGVVFLSPLGAGTNAALAIFSSGPGRVDAWADFNHDGDWVDGGEQVLASFAVHVGSNHVGMLLSPLAVPGKTFWRFRLSTAGGLAPTGFAADGEVEDYAANVLAYTPGGGGGGGGGNGQDWGDAPAGYRTLAADYGASHLLSDSLYLGGSVDPEPDGQPNALATSDGADEDGVAFVTPIKFGIASTANVNVAGAGFLNAWIDFNGDGDWDDAGEQIATALPVNFLNNPNPVPFSAPVGSKPGQTFARFRYSIDAIVSPHGSGRDGEVEDYRVTILQPVVGP